MNSALPRYRRDTALRGTGSNIYNNSRSPRDEISSGIEPEPPIIISCKITHPLYGKHATRISFDHSQFYWNFKRERRTTRPRDVILSLPAL